MDFESFYHTHKDLFYRWAYSYTHNREDARDIVQEACMIVASRWERIHKMDNAVGYTLRVIGNLAKKYHAYPHPLLLDDEGWDTLSAEIDIENKIDQERQEAWLYQALNSLKTVEKEVILLRDIEGMEFATLARHLGLNLSTAKSHYRRGKLKLITLWEETYGKNM
ncbi:MAG: sigma-70 family RNA polymerase sigma factor [Brevinematales bacterium]|nr:sigma-70 family RNA polymerase sigma factor [Brevinematales bacterium]